MSNKREKEGKYRSERDAGTKIARLERIRELIGKAQAANFDCDRRLLEAIDSLDAVLGDLRKW